MTTSTRCPRLFGAFAAAVLLAGMAGLQPVHSEVPLAADQGQRQMRHWRQVGGADRADFRHLRVDATIEQRDEALEHGKRGAGAAAREAIRPDQQGRPHDLGRHSRADRDGAADQDALLEGGDVGGVETQPDIGAEPGGERGFERGSGGLDEAPASGWLNK